MVVEAAILGGKNILLTIEVLMSAEKTAADLTPHIEAAEKAVAAVKDPRLREIAFGRILDHLLATNSSTPVRANHAAAEGTVLKKSKTKAGSTGVTAWLRELVEEGFFSDPQSVKNIIQEFGNRSHHVRGTDLTRQLQNFCHDKVLRRRKQMPADGGKEVFHWSNW
jgi:hypothetical protein